MKTDKELREEVRRIRDRVQRLSGFWIGEAAAAIYSLEWAMGKREPPPSEDLGSARGGRGKIAEALIKLAEKAPAGVGKKMPKRAAISRVSHEEGAKTLKPRSRPSRAKR